MLKLIPRDEERMALAYARKTGDKEMEELVLGQLDNIGDVGVDNALRYISNLFSEHAIHQQTNPMWQRMRVQDASAQRTTSGRQGLTGRHYVQWDSGDTG